MLSFSVWHPNYQFTNTLVSYLKDTNKWEKLNLLCNPKKKKIKNGECLIEMCHIIPSSKENTLWQKGSQNLVLGWDRAESAQSLMYIFGMVNPSQKRGLAPAFHPPMNTDLSLPNSPLLQQWQHITFVSQIILGTNIYRQAGRTQASPKFHPCNFNFQSGSAVTLMLPKPCWK